MSLTIDRGVRSSCFQLCYLGFTRFLKASYKFCRRSGPGFPSLIGETALGLNPVTCYGNVALPLWVSISSSVKWREIFPRVVSVK